jgi:hypothetical protein
MSTSIVFWQEALLKSTPRAIKLRYNITAAVTFVAQVPGYPALVSAGAITLAQLDAALHKSNGDNVSGEFTAAQFDATSMGADVFGGVVDMHGQVKTLLNMVAKAYSGTGGATLVERSVASSTSLTASTLVTECAKGSEGNVGFKVDFGNTPDFDALTAGQVHVDLEWISK